MDRSEQVINTPFFARQLWWLGPLISLFLAFQVKFFHIKQSFDEAADLAVQQIETKVNTFELALAGFANFLAVAGDIDDPEIRTYVQGIRKLYPDLYKFEIARRIEHAERSRFEQAMVEKGYPDFLIHGFDYDD
ncbi:MAG: CHASE domain-containing protein, partial [Motiliproteus sp.]